MNPPAPATAVEMDGPSRAEYCDLHELMERNMVDHVETVEADTRMRPEDARRMLAFALLWLYEEQRSQIALVWRDAL